MADKLIAVDFETGAVYSWSMDGFSFSEGIDLPSFDHPMIIPIDQDTAQQLAQWLDQDPYQSYDVRDTDPEERNIFEMADPDIDYEELDMVYSIIADASGYTPAERSLNAKRQVRGIGGKFGGKQIPQGSKLQAFKKGKLADQLPIIPNPGQRIQEWLATANAVTAAGSQSTAQPSTDPVPPVQNGTSAQMANPADQPQGDSIYFAIVDASDSTAVLEALAITKDANGQPQAWVRSHGSWRNSPDTLTKLTGATPPPVVELTAPEPAKTVISQVDASEANIGHFPTTPISASGFVTSDGELFVYAPEDISELVNVFDSLDPSLQPEAKRLARRRARALNRMDILPEDWRTASTIERGEAIASESPLYGDFGQVITAAGHPFDGAKGAERLKQYWIHGKGALKIRWGTRGDLTRAHRHLAKFVGPDRAWGLAQNYHKSLFGMSNAKHDKLTGQR